MRRHINRPTKIYQNLDCSWPVTLKTDNSDNFKYGNKMNLEPVLINLALKGRPVV